MCDCIERVNEKLKEANMNTVIDLPLIISGNRFGVGRCCVETRKLDEKNRKKPVSLFATFCPFCGVKYEEKSATDNNEVVEENKKEK